MAANNNKQAEELNGIEQMNESLTSLGSKMEKNKKKIGMVIAAVVVVVIAVFGFMFFNERSKAESAKKYSGIEAKAAAAAQKADPALQDSVFNAMAMKDLQALAKADNGVGGTLANLDLAARYYGEKKYNEAISCLRKVDISEPVMKANAEILLADCYVNTKKYADALAALDGAVSIAKATPEIAVRALLKKATVLDEQKKYADALAVYEQIKGEYAQQTAQMAATGVNIDAFIAREEARLGK